MYRRLITATALVLAMMLILVAGSAGTAVAAPTEPIEVAAALDAALNAGDVEATLALWADNAVARQIPPPPGSTGVFTGKAELRAWIQALVAQHIQIELVGSRQVSGNRVTWTARVWLDDWRQLGIAPLVDVANATVQGGKITDFTAALTPESVARLQAATGAAPGMPNTGGGGRAGGTPAAATALALGLLGIGVIAGAVVRRRRERSPA